MTGHVAYVIIIVMLAAWSGIAWFWWMAMNATTESDFFPPAGLAAFAAFLFTGPFCLVIWYSLMLRLIFIRPKPRT